MGTYPSIILLNGTSSSGKSSIARQLQEKLDHQYLNISIDTILYALPPSDLKAMMSGERIVRTGYKYSQLVDGFHATITGLLKAGLRLIVDNAITCDNWRKDFELAVAGYCGIKVGIMCDIEEARRREIGRGDRAVGTADAELPLVHKGMNYDFTVNTSDKTPQECANAIVSFLKK